MAGGKDKKVTNTGKRSKRDGSSGSQPPSEPIVPSETQEASGSQPTPAIPPQPNELNLVPLVYDPTLIPAEELRNYINHPNNRFIFRNEDAWRTYNGRALQKSISQVFYYKLPEEIHIPVWEKDQINAMIDLWKWRPLIELNFGYYPHLVRLLYANMVDHKNPWGLRTYYGGREIGITPDNITRLLDLEPVTDEDVQVYPFQKWSDINVGTEHGYHSVL